MCRFDAAQGCMAALLLGLSAIPGHAAQLNGQFNVTVSLRSANSPSAQTAFCGTRPGGRAFGTSITVTCSTGIVDLTAVNTGMPWIPVYDGTYHLNYTIYASLGNHLLGTIDSYISADTTTSWRVVSLMNWGYIEMLASW